MLYTRTNLNLGKAASERSPRSAHLVHDGGERTQPTQHKFKVERVYAILFDLDGTLLDTAPEFVFCMNQLLAENELPLVTTESLRASVSQGASGMIACAFQSALQDFNIAQLKKRFLDLYRASIGTHTGFFAGIPSLLNSLDKQGIPWGIVTNKPAEFTLPLIQQFAPLAHAKCVISGDTLSVSKPHPDPLFLAANQLGQSPQVCWYVGDAKTDVEASRAAGMKSIIANYGYLPLDEDPLTWQADGYIQHPDQMLDYLNMG